MFRKPLCPKCFKEVASDARTCGACGAAFEAPLFRAPATYQLPAQRVLRWGWVAAAVLVILGAAGIASAVLLLISFKGQSAGGLGRFVENLPWALMAGFFAGGILVARVSRGSTIREPALAAAVAAIAAILGLGIAQPSQLIVWILAGIPAAVLAGLGAALGEFLQHLSRPKGEPR